MTRPVRFEIEGALARITLARPDAGNAINQSFADQLLEIAHTCESEDRIRAVPLTGTGSPFGLFWV